MQEHELREQRPFFPSSCLSAFVLKKSAPNLLGNIPMTLVEMPKANENLTEATLDRWLVREGDVVTVNQSLCDIITDKAKFEMPSPAAGTILKLCGPERAVLPVGYVMCVIGAPGELIPASLDVKNDALLAAHKGMVTAVSSAPAIAIDTVSTAVRATPAARRVAKELNVDLAAVAKTLNLSGPVNEKDVRAFYEPEQ